METEVNRDELNWGMACHLSALAGLFVGVGHIIAPLVIWLTKKDQYPFVDDQGRESLNFQISMTIYGIVAAILMIVLIGFVLLPIIYLVDIVYTIIASVRSSSGERYRYPFNLRLVK